MTISPQKGTLVSVTRDELERLYVKNDFDKLLANIVPIPVGQERYLPNNRLRPGTVEIKEYKYRSNGVTIAVIFYYVHSDGSETRSLRMLRVDDVRYEAARLSPYPFGR